MRITKFTRLLSMVLAAVLLFGVFASVLAFAEDVAGDENTAEGTVTEETVGVEIISKNLNYASRTEIVYAVEATGVEKTDSIIMLFWDAAQADDGYTYENALYRKSFYGKGTVLGVEGCYLFASRGIAPKEINDSIYARPAVRHVEMVDGEANITYTYGEVLKYNIGMYAAEKLSETDNSAAQNELYQGLIAYSEAAGAMFGASEPDYVLAKIVDGAASFGNFGAKYATADKDGKLTLRADAVNAEGKYFIKWTDAEGNELSTSRIAKVDAPSEEGTHVYTPVYGDAAESAYADTIGFQNFAAGEVYVGTPNYAAAPGTACYGSYSGTNMKRWNYNKTINSVKFHQNVTPAYTAYDSATKTYTFEKNALGHYVFGAKDSFFINEDLAGNKELLVDRGQFGAGWTVGLIPQTSDRTVLKQAELDLGFEDLTIDGVQIHVNVTLKNSAGSSFSFRTNLFSYKDKGLSHIYPEGFNSDSIKDEGGTEHKCFSSNSGETFTLGIRVISETTGEGEEATTAYFLEYYINGEYFGRISASLFKSSSKTIEQAGFDMTETYISDISVNTVTANKDNVIIDNVTFSK